MLKLHDIALYFLVFLLLVGTQGASDNYCDGVTFCAFDDLSGEEIKTAVRIVKTSGKFSDDISFPIVRTQEPKKSLWKAGGDAVKKQRVAYLAIFDYKTNLLSEVLVDLRTQSLVKTTAQPDMLPPIMDKEVEDMRKILVSDPRIRKGAARRGLNISYIEFDPWAIGTSGPSVNTPGKRLIRTRIYYKPEGTRYPYWSPIEGLEAVVDLNKGAIDTFFDIETTRLATPYQVQPKLLDAKPPFKPLAITQSEGSSIKVSRQEVHWYKWKFHYSMDPIHGLQLHHIRYQGDCEERLVLYKISVAEMLVPYGAKGKLWRWLEPLDVSEYGFGKLSVINTLKIGTDLPDNALLFPCTVTNDTTGEPIVVDGCIGAYEENAGVIYKHDSDIFEEKGDARRGRTMVMTFFVSVGNYDYGFDYIFHMDGTLEVRSRLTGIVLARGTNITMANPDCITDCPGILDNYLIGQPHQHFFNYRMDFDVDGVSNYVAQVDVTNDPFDPVENPDGGAFSAKKTLITTEGFRNYKLEHARTWQILNGNSRNKFATPRSYTIKPVDIAYSYMRNGNRYLKQAEFVKHPFWATAYKDEEMSAAGEFGRTGKPYQGLPSYVKDKESLENTDVVAWYTFGVTHIPRPEEWPIMNVHTAGFLMVPFNFLSQNSEVPLKGTCP